MTVISCDLVRSPACAQVLRGAAPKIGMLPHTLFYSSLLVHDAVSAFPRFVVAFFLRSSDTSSGSILADLETSLDGTPDAASGRWVPGGWR
jgi:hypothetical protein